MNFSRTLFLIVFLSFCLGETRAFAQDPMPQTPTGDELFRDGMKLYQGGQFGESAKSFETLARQQPNQPELLLNWGLAEYQAGRRGLGVALWRKALTLNPSLSAARSALDFATRAMQLRDFDETQLLDRVRQNFLAHVGLDQMLSVTLIFLATGGWLLLGYLGRRRKSLRNELPLPAFSWAGTILSCAFVISLLLTAFKAIDSSIPHATAITITSVRTGPDNTSSSLFELREGSDVTLRQAKKGWTQIRYPGGMSGWVPNETLFQTSGLPIW